MPGNIYCAQLHFEAGGGAGSYNSCFSVQPTAVGHLLLPAAACAQLSGNHYMLPQHHQPAAAIACCCSVDAPIHSLLDELLQQLRQLLGVMGAVDDGGACGFVKVGLCAQLTPVELQDVCCGVLHGVQTEENK